MELLLAFFFTVPLWFTWQPKWPEAILIVSRLLIPTTGGWYRLSGQLFFFLVFIFFSKIYKKLLVEDV
jgi:hypothetical protein